MSRWVPSSVGHSLGRVCAFAALFVSVWMAPLGAHADTGLDFPANGGAWNDVRFHFTGSSLQPMYPATYIWRVNHRQQTGYYAVMYWGSDGSFNPSAYYGARPYPTSGSTSTTHRWSFAANGTDAVTDANGNSTQLGYGVWKTQALRVYDNGTAKVHELYWDLPDTTKVIRMSLPRSYGSTLPSRPALSFGAAPWDYVSQRLNGVLRGIQTYSSVLSVSDMLTEASSPLSTSAGSASIWYLNLNPTPTDISDKSGKGHHPSWASSARPALWSNSTAPTVTLSASPTSVASGGSSTLSWSSTNATSCTASGAWSGSKATSGSASTGSLTASKEYTLSCTGSSGTTSQKVTVTVTSSTPAPTVSIAASPTSVTSGGSSTLTWSSTNASSCSASGSWSGGKPTSGSASTGSLTANSTFTLSCIGAGGSASKSASVTVTASVTPAPTITLTANPTSVSSGGSSTLSWSTSYASSCSASGSWSGAKATSGSASTGALSATSNFTLSCSGSGGSTSKTVTVSVSGSTTITGLNFPSNGSTSADVRFRFTGSALLPMYPATYIWRVNPRQQAGYYTTFFWGPDGAFTGASYYGAHPYPDSPTSTTHHWELSIDGKDFINDANGNSTLLGYGAWKTQALRVYDNGTNKVHEFYWDLPDTTRVIRVLLDRSYGSTAPSNPALNFGDAPWSRGNERLSGILRGIQLYNSALSVADILSEASTPLSTSAGSSAIWYLNMNPTPSDISDKSGKGHNPSWASSARPSLWSQ